MRGVAVCVGGSLGMRLGYSREGGLIYRSSIHPQQGATSGSLWLSCGSLVGLLMGLNTTVDE